MNKDKREISETTSYLKYARFDETKGRRETWNEIVRRNKKMHVKKFKFLYDNDMDFKNILDKSYELVNSKKVMPSMRSMQFGGKAIEVTNSRMFNCCYGPIDSMETFPEAMFLLLGGSGVGYSVQRAHVNQLPIKYEHTGKSRSHQIDDSKEGWADAIRECTAAKMQGYDIDFDYSLIRPKGAPLITSGGRAPGPEPLRICINNISNLIDKVEVGNKLKPIEAHDIMCFLADAVLSGGIRRAAMISLFDHDEIDMLLSKTGEWWKKNPQRARANNSVVFNRNTVTKKMFDSVWDRVENSGAGEPGISFTNKPYVGGYNPCHEIFLKNYSFCNLTEINVNKIENEEDLIERVQAAAFLGTLQASYTDFNYLRPIWKENAESEALIGVSMTGIASGDIDNYDLTKMAEEVKRINQKYAAMIGINPALRTTCIKPSGTTSLVAGTSSGIHAWHNDYYIRRIRVKKSEPIYDYLMETNPLLIEDDAFDKVHGAVLSFPQKAPKGAKMRTEPTTDLLARIKKFNLEWVRAGHVAGEDYHNVSATVSVRPNEWNMVGKWMWDNRDSYNGISLLPYDDHTYVQAPFEDITEEEYKMMRAYMNKIDLTQIEENYDMTNLQGEAACAGGMCEIDFNKSNISES